MASQRRVIILIDAIDQFKKTSRGKLTTWLPRLWPINARLVATGLAGGASKALAERPGVEALTLPPLELPEAHHRRGMQSQPAQAGPPVIDALLAKKHAGGPAWGNPLWLVLALEELELLAPVILPTCSANIWHSGGASAKCDAGCGRPNAYGILLLYRATFDSAAELLGPATASAFIGLLSAGRTGWRESDFRQLLPQVSGEAWDQKRFAALRNLFRGQIHQHGDLAQLDFNHPQMRAAARSRLAALASRIPTSPLIADHLLTLAPDDRLR